MTEKEHLIAQISSIVEDMEMDDDHNENLVTLRDTIGRIASRGLFQSMLMGQGIDWFDHRHHMLDPSVQNRCSWVESAANPLRKLKANSTMLDICAGDAWYSRYFFVNYCTRIDCIDRGDVVSDHAKKINSHPNIKYKVADVLTADLGENRYDMAFIRGAIEHFSKDDQVLIFKKAARALVPGGWFCGDTPLERDEKLSIHDYEWSSEDVGRELLEEAFVNVTIYSVYDHIGDRTTIFWNCQKP